MAAKRESGRSRQREEPEPAPTDGTVRAGVLALIAELGITGEAPAGQRARAALALNLASQLDGDAGMASAAISRELRATLDDLEGTDGPDADSDFARWQRQLGTPSV